MNIGKAIENILQIKDVTQRELADMIGVDEVTISRYINNKRTPRLEIMISISKALNVGLDDLLGIDAEKYDEEILKYNKVAKLAQDSKVTPEDLESYIRFLNRDKDR
jgi:transcriptional regulator with XRE-family HTH domain